MSESTQDRWTDWSAAVVANGDTELLRMMAELRSLRLDTNPLNVRRATTR